MIYLGMLNQSTHQNQTSKGIIWLRNIAFLCMIGFLLYHWFPFPPIVWRLGLVVLSLLGLLIHRCYPFNTVEKAMLVFVSVNVIHYIISFIWQTPETTNFGDVLCSGLPLFLFFVLTVRGGITDRSLLIFLIIVCLAGIVYFRYADVLLMQRYTWRESGQITNNAGVLFLVILPLLFFVKDKRIVLIIIAEILYFTLLSAKRGNILSSLIPMFLLIRFTLKSTHNWLMRFVFFLGIMVVFAFCIYQASGNEYLMDRIERTVQGDSSGRDIIFANAWSSWYNSDSFFHLLFGHGTDATVRLNRTRSHNDWLEILVDFGLLGAICYLVFFISLLRITLKSRHCTEIFYALLSVLMIWFLKSLFSMGFTENLFSYLSMAIGISLGKLYVIEHSKYQGSSCNHSQTI